MPTAKTPFVVEIDTEVVTAARGAAMLHGISLEVVVANVVTKTLSDYVDKVRKAVPELEEPMKELSEDDIPF